MNGTLEETISYHRWEIRPLRCIQAPIYICVRTYCDKGYKAQLSCDYKGWGPFVRELKWGKNVNHHERGAQQRFTFFVDAVSTSLVFILLLLTIIPSRAHGPRGL